MDSKFDNDYINAVMRAARGGDLKFIANAIENEGFGVNIPDRDCCTALFHAVSNCQNEVSKYLVSKNADVNTKNDEGRPLLFEAIAAGSSTDLVKFLVSSGAEWNGILHHCVEWEAPELLEFFIEKGGDVNAKGKKDNTPLHIAAKKNNPQLVKILLNAKACASAKNESGQTPIAKLIGQDSHQIKEVLSLLVSGGSSPNEKDEDDNTHLHKICSSEATLLDSIKIRSLLEVGADPQLTNSSGQTPAETLEEEFEGPENVKKIIAGFLNNGANWKPEELGGDSSFILFVKTMYGSIYPLALPNGEQTTIGQVKEAINKKEEVPPEDNVLKLGSLLLDHNDSTLRDYKIKHEDAILSILLAKRL